MSDYTPTTSPVPATSTPLRRSQRKAQNAPPASASNWLGATNGVTPFAQQQHVPSPREEQAGYAGKGKRREKSAKEAYMEYGRGHASEEVGSEQDVNGGMNVNGDMQQQLPPDQDLLPERQAQAQLQQQHQQLQRLQAYHRPRPLLSTTHPEAQAYRTFLENAKHRRLQRHDLATRDSIWTQSIERSRARLAAVNEEKASLEAKLVAMEREREVYKARHVVGVSLMDDEREERRWEEWLRVQRGVEVGGVDDEGRRRVEGEGKEVCGVDI